MEAVGRAVLGADSAVSGAEKALAAMPAHKKLMAGAEFGAVVAALRAIQRAQWEIAAALAPMKGGE